MYLPLDKETANEIYDILVVIAGASESWRENFVYHQTNGVISEYRFPGRLGFGGKFWRNMGIREDGTWGERWYVNQYSEDETLESLDIIEITNRLLWNLQQS